METVPIREIADYPASLLRVLAALSRAPLGLPSARRVAARAGISPTVAARRLAEASHRGFVRLRAAASERGSRARWHVDTEAWPADLLDAVRAVRLPRREVHEETDRRVPPRLRRWFWNADAAHLDLAVDGSYIAHRLLQSPDVAAWEWALRNIAPADVRAAVSRRGVSPQVRALAANWERSHRRDD